jgi:cyclophilin family peptidyl-prolyl cis-trans isomerase
MAETVVIETSKGNIEVELKREFAPITVENFVKYVESKHYDGTVFHRVIKGFMVQGGGFASNGKEKSVRAPIRLEAGNGLQNKNGTIAMARTNEPNSATAQFFINVADNSFLDAGSNGDGYAVFGKVVSGMEVVQAIEKVKTGSKGHYDDWPAEDVLIKKAYMKK